MVSFYVYLTAAELKAFLVYFAEFTLAISVEMETKFKEPQHLKDATLHNNN
jgi:hypothetical protein